MSLIRNSIVPFVLSLILVQVTLSSHAQLGISFDIKKPKEFENRTLKSEKSDRGRFSAPKRFIQNTVTHYNYFFNANNKLNEVLERAKFSFRDDYSRRLAFYNYTLDATAADSMQLDSISYKAQTGLVLHDLRSDWADNMYLLWGTSYYLKKQFDSAYLMYQFINYAFAEKEKDGYYRTIGSARDGNNALSISTKESNSLLKRATSRPPSRNDAFIWQIRNYLAQDKYAEAASLVTALKNDSLFPKRLHNDLEEVQAYSFYRQQMWDSSAAHLELALSNATNQQERARWEYLIGQLYEGSGKFTQSAHYYSKAITHTTDPIMDVYARLALVRVNKDDDNTIDKNIERLLKMAKRDKYLDYRDIIYYMAAQMELERQNTEAAIALLYRSTTYPANNLSQRNKAFLQLAQLSYKQRRYRQAYNFYDSLQLSDTALKNLDEIESRKSILARLASSIEVEARQDSLQRIAALPEDERTAYVKKLARAMRKAQGLKEEGAMTTGSPIAAPAAPTLFTEPKKGEWYFYNTTSRQKGQADFKAKWGNRPNQDNWRRASAINSIVRKPGANDLGTAPGSANAPAAENTEISFDNLYDKLPLTPEKIQASNDSIELSLFTQGMIYIQELEDCTLGVETLEDLRNRFPGNKKMDEVLFNLVYCYRKNGDAAKAKTLQDEMNKSFAKSNLTTIINTGVDPKSDKPSAVATRTYERIYDLFIEGKFEQAIAEKRVADSIYGKYHWTPQLLYIEAVYYIKQQQDSSATAVLNNIIKQFPEERMAEKAATLLDVLSRRLQIEEELRNLVNIMPAEDTSVTRTYPRVSNPVTAQPRTDTVAAAPPVTPPAVKPVVKDTVSTAAPTIKPVIKDTVAAAPPVVNKPVPAIPRDTLAVVKPKPKPDQYGYEPAVPHYVVLILNKVDPIFVNEARNAFARYNRDTYYNKQMTASLVDLDAENKLLLISPFATAAEAITYIDQARPRTATEIVPWLKGGKYTYSILSEANLELLKGKKDIQAYQQYLRNQLPGKFD